MPTSTGTKRGLPIMEQDPPAPKRGRGRPRKAKGQNSGHLTMVARPAMVAVGNETGTTESADV